MYNYKQNFVELKMKTAKAAEIQRLKVLCLSIQIIILDICFYPGTQYIDK